tara:strand:- start:528 stop:2024 length:1497 start_codon:yes stop_codon:yes gene_type:complete
MAYTVNKTNSSSSPNQYTVQDGVVNTQTDLSFIGKGYAGYGESIAENFLHLLENFSNTSAPTKPIQGQLWWDSTNSKLQVYNGTAFQTAGGSAPYQSDPPSNMAAGDIWIDSDTGQMYYYSGTSSVLVGPPSSTGTTNGFTYDTILDSGDTSQNITKLFNDGNLIAIISEDTFTPKVTLSGFASIKKGITLTTAIADTKFQGTATDADALGGVEAANYLRSNANDTTSGTLGITTDSGFTVGADSDLSITVDGTGISVANTVQNTDITFKVNDGGVTSTVMTIDGSESRIGIGTTTPTTKLDISGTTTSTAFVGPITGNVTGNITSTGANSMTTLTMGGNLTSKAILPDATTTYDIGSTSKKYNTVHAKATSAQYADLAEIYETDAEYGVGTVVVFGGEAEVTISTEGNDPRVAGVISEKPAYLMNSESEGQPVALIGKVPCKVVGHIVKGDMLSTDPANNGVAKKTHDPQVGEVIGKALENYNSEEIGMINIVVGRC